METDKIEYKNANDPISNEAMERLVQIMTDSPTLLKLKSTEWEITALKPAVQWQIAKEAVNINKIESATFGDVLKELSLDFPVVCKVLTLALLNDKERIKNEYDKVYDTLMWECEVCDWGNILFEVLNLLSIEVFFCITGRIQMFRQISLERKKTTEERQLS